MLGWLPVLQDHGADGQSALAADAAAQAGTSPVFWIILIGYFIGVLGFGSYFARYNRTTQDFFFGGRRFSWWLITMSIVATGVGSHSFIKYSGKGFGHGFSSTMAYMNDWFFMPLFMFGWLPIIYFMQVRSIPEYFERRFNRGVRILATIALLIYMIGYIGIGFLTMTKTLLPVLEPQGWSQAQIIWVVAAVAGVYITFGGQTAVIFTDLLQGFILLIAGMVLFLLGLDFLGGFDVFWNALPAEFKLPLADYNKPADFNFVGIFWQDAIAGSIGFLFMNQGLIMRFMACRSVNEGRKAAAFNVLFLLPLSALAVSGAGWIAKAISVTNPEIISPDSAPDSVFTLMASVVASPAGFGFFVAAVTAALMSTVDTLINAVAAVVINDIYRPLVPHEKDRHYLNVAMVVSAVATLLGVGGAFLMDRIGDLYDAHGFFHATATPPLVTAIFLGIFWRRFTTAGAVSVFFIGTGLMLLAVKLPHELIGPFSHGIPTPEGEMPFKYVRALYNMVVCFGVGIGVSLFTQPKESKTLEGLTMWTVESARRFFKGGEPNDRPGERMELAWKVNDALPPGTISVDEEAAKTLAADPGDLVYLSDRRWWLGGLRSAHAKVHGATGPKGVVEIATDVEQAGHFLRQYGLRVEKEF
ncbi:MAG: sodium:solute symporter family protein [Planctomycetota bacterium]|nr:MAG: sodium:solute symporter family protein [Planctomycetota bacterium]